MVLTEPTSECFSVLSPAEKGVCPMQKPIRKDEVGMPVREANWSRRLMEKLRAGITFKKTKTTIYEIKIPVNRETEKAEDAD